MNTPTLPKRESGIFALAGVVMTLVVFLACAGLLLPPRSNARQSAMWCAGNLRQIGQAYQLYLGDFRAPPPDLVTLAVTQNLELYHLACEVTYPDWPNSKLTVSQQADIIRAQPLKYISYEYIYRPTPAGPDEIIAYDRLENHTGHFSIPSDINVLFGDGRVERWKIADVQKMLQAPTK